MMAAAAATATGVALNRLGSSSHGRGHNGSGGDGGDGVGGVGGVRGEAESTARLLPACSHVPLARSRSRSPSGPQKNSTASTTISTTHTRQHAPPLSRIATSPLMLESMSLARSSPCLASHASLAARLPALTGGFAHRGMPPGIGLGGVFRPVLSEPAAAHDAPDGLLQLMARLLDHPRWNW